jgi:chromatin segregation and condensation protein Rec8/ScpA/Scc1 (kleisin family)
MRNLIIVAVLLSFTACSIFQTSEQEEKVAEENEKIDEVYVFDEVSESEEKADQIKELEEELDNTLNRGQEDNVVDLDAFGEPIGGNNTVNELEGKSFFLQLGAFSTLKNAEQHVYEIKSQVPFVLSIIYNSETSLYTVRSTPYLTKIEVEQIRDDFWNKNLFIDAFIVTE